MDTISKLLEKYKMDPVDAAKQSRNWFTQQMNLLNKTKLNRAVLMSTRDEMIKETRIMPGCMYIFEYDALNSDTLPYWDRFPLIIPFKQVKGGFYGLNLHYLHPQLRAQLLGVLMRFASNKELDENTKLKFTWQAASTAAKHKFIGACVKHYLNPQVRSKFLRILPEHWSGAIMLPVESFEGAGKQTVWRDSRKG